MQYAIPPPRSFDPDEQHEGIRLCADAPIGTDRPVEYYKQVAVNALAYQIAQVIEPEFIEADGFEVLRYSIVLIRNGDDGRNSIKKPS